MLESLGMKYSVKKYLGKEACARMADNWSAAESDNRSLLDGTIIL
jgi:hypothetical protein